MLTDRECARMPDFEMEISHRLAQLVGDPRGMLGLAILEQHAEFVASQARQRIAFAQPLLQHHADLPHQLVACGVAGRIVDQFELIQIEIHHRVVAAQLPRACQGQAASMFEFTAVDQAGERVVARLVRHCVA